jgi:uncharacterized cupredoxin-like copper-binding protein
MNRKLQLVISAVAALGAVAVFAVPALARQDAAVSRKVQAVDLKFNLPLKSAHPGRVTFLVHNSGHVPHDFKIAGKKTPLIQPGKSATLKVTLRKGKYPYLCTVPGHAAAGMKGIFVAK